MDNYTAPDRVTIATPQPVIRLRGVQAASSDMLGCNFRTRLCLRDRKALDRAAEICGIAPTAFARWSIMKMVHTIVADYEKFAEEQEITEA